MKTQSTLLLFLLAAAISCSGSKGKPDGGSTDGGDDGGDTDTGEDPLSHLAVACTAGSGHTCALTAAGGVKCWGANNYGQVGAYPSAISYTPPDQAEPLQSGVVDICAESWNTCALMDDGGVKCWGDNLYGQLGNGSMGGGYEYVPDDVIGLGGKAVQVECGMQFACALLENGKIMCWGDGGTGQLGNGVDLDLCVDWYSCIQPEPAEVVISKAEFEYFSAGYNSVCARTKSGDNDLFCWGSGTILGGNGPDLITTSLPVLNDEAPNNVAVLDLKTHACSISNDGFLFCWGSNWNGQIGNGQTEQFAVWTPFEVGSFSASPTDVSVGSEHSCAALDDGAARCWGANDRGTLGNGDWGYNLSSTTPVEVIELDNDFVVSLCSGQNHTCAIMDDGSMKCWGQGSSGQLGNDIDIDTCQELEDCIFPEPVDVIGFGPDSDGS